MFVLRSFVGALPSRTARLLLLLLLPVMSAFVAYGAESESRLCVIASVVGVAGEKAWGEEVIPSLALDPSICCKNNIHRPPSSYIHKQPCAV